MCVSMENTSLRESERGTVSLLYSIIMKVHYSSYLEREHGQKFLRANVSYPEDKSVPFMT